MNPGEPIGKGCLVLVVGPSGAGKDTLIGIAREHFAGDPGVAFPRRLVTRGASVFEDHDTFTEREFSRGCDEGRYPLAWRAHGHCYALPPSVSDDIASGRTVVANVSRSVVARARELFVRVRVVLVSAPEEVLSQRILARGRDPDTGARMARAAPDPGELVPDLVIENVGSPGEAAAPLIALIRTAASVRAGQRDNQSA
jgi:ribose 1,5-bisphosphokinase